MEPHPIPQNVTSFQFKLVGDMTLKQFGYLAAGCAIAYLLFVFLAHDYPLITWPLIIISALSGIAFAFLPLGSRPLDHWVAAFLKAIYSPTRRVWKKNGQTYKEDALFASRLVMYLTGTNQIRPEDQKTSVSDTLTHRPTDTPTRLPDGQVLSETPSTAELPTPEELQKTVDLARQAQSLQMKIVQNERILSQIKTQAQKPTPIPVDYSEQVNKILADLRNLIGQASAIKQQIHLVTEGQQPQDQTAAVPQLIPRTKVLVVTPPKPKQTQLTLTTFPNVINGVIKDKENNYLEGVVAVIYDKEGLPVRALKTNKLGQFSGSTPLPNGTYTLELEKDNFAFDVLQIELTGQVLSPLLITSK